MTNKRPLSVFVTSLVVCWAASSSQAAIYVPPGLNPGDTYHLAFVTRDRHDAISSDINAYNAFVQDQAALNPLLTGTDVGVTWKAIASTPDVDARDNALVAAPVYLLDGTKIADDFADMWDGDIDSAFDTTQFGSELFSFIWTGSDPSGVEAGFGVTYGLGSPTAISEAGVTDTSGPGWIDYFPDNQSQIYRLYALSEELEVPASIPEPSSCVVWLCLASVVGLVGRYRRWTA